MTAGRACRMCPILHRKIESQRVLREAPVSEPVATLLCNIAQILDVVKIEWAESWSEWDQQQRDGITAFLTAYYASRAEAPEAPRTGKTKL